MQKSLLCKIKLYSWTYNSRAEKSFPLLTKIIKIHLPIKGFYLFFLCEIETFRNHFSCGFPQKKKKKTSLFLNF